MVTLEYRGTSFHGFQKQPGLPTIQGALESALVAFTGEEIRTQGAGRTDTGAHAVGQTAAFDLPYEVDTGKAMVSLNALLPNDIAVTSMSRVRDGFDARRDAEWREYRYFVLNRVAPSALLDEFAYHFPWELDLDLMQRACSACEGRHDFSAFRAKSQDESTERDILVCRVAEMIPGLTGIIVRADSFLYRMVRILAGAITSVGTGRMHLEEFLGYLENGSSKPCTDPLPSRGLFLWQVSYPADVYILD